MSADETKGYEIVKKACFAPFKRILENCGIEDYYSILHELGTLRDGKVNPDNLFTYDAKSGTIVNAMTAGLLDPTKVTRTAIESAASVAGTILTTESVIFEKKDDKKNQEADMGQMF